MEKRGYAFEAAEASFKLLIQKVLKKHKPFFALHGFRVIVEKRSTASARLEATVKLTRQRAWSTRWARATARWTR
jgi:2-isopropylmalate synthase